MDKIVKFILEKYGVKARWRIIPLTSDDQWDKLTLDRARLDILVWARVKQIKMELESKDINLNEFIYLHKTLAMSQEKEREIEKEYGRVPTIEENLNSYSINLEVKPLKRLFRYQKMRKALPFFFKLLKKNKHRDFLILLNIPLIKQSQCSKREKLKSVAHETIHFIENTIGKKSNFKSIENEADRIVNEYLIKKE